MTVGLSPGSHVRRPGAGARNRGPYPMISAACGDAARNKYGHDFRHAPASRKKTLFPQLARFCGRFFSTMGILGTSSQEEQQLRSAAIALATALASHSRQSFAETTSSAYETASENEHHVASDVDSTATIQQPDHLAPQQLVKMDTSGDDSGDDAIRDVDEFDPSGMSEDQLNRVASTRSHLSSAVSRTLSRTISNGQPVEVADLDWDGPDDKANPFNWPARKKWFITMTAACSCLCISLGSSLYVEGVPELEEKWGISQTLGLSGLTFYLVGLALGPVVAAPLSEMIGRRLIYITLFPTSMLFFMGVGLAQNIRTVLVLRFFAGFAASPPMSIAGGTMSDMWGNSPADMSIAMALFCLAPFLGPVVGPIVGGFATEHKNWRWTMWVSLMFFGAVLPFLLACPETYKHAILKARAKKRGIPLKTPKMNGAFFVMCIRQFLIRPLEMLIVEPIVALTSLYVAFVFAVLFGFFEAFPIIFRGVYRMDTGVSGLPFIAVGIGLVLGVFLYIVLDKVYFYPKQPDGSRGKTDAEGKPVWDPPESKLVIAIGGSVFLPISLFWLAWTSKASVHWIAPTLAGVPFGFGLIWIFFGVIFYYSLSYPPIFLASALAANNLLRYLVASVFPLFMVQMYEKLHIDWATTLLAFIALAMVPIPFMFYKFGSRIRAHSKYSYTAYFKKLAADKAAAAAAQEKLHTENTTASTSESHVSQTAAEAEVAEKV